MLVFHGSTVAVPEPSVTYSSRMLDFGRGFYVTTNKDQAIRWSERVSARRGVRERVLSVYEFDMEAARKRLSCLVFDSADVEWLGFVCSCRSGGDHSYDLVSGPVADDTIFSTIRLFESHTLTASETIERLKVQKLFDQMLLHTEKAMAFLRFIESVDLTGANHGR